MQARKNESGTIMCFGGALIFAFACLTANARLVKYSEVSDALRIDCDPGETFLDVNVTVLKSTGVLTIGPGVSLLVKEAEAGHQIHFEGDTVRMRGWATTAVPFQPLSDLNWDAPAATKFVAGGSFDLGTVPTSIGGRALIVADGADITLVANHDCPIVSEGGKVTFKDNSDWQKKVYMWADTTRSAFNRLSGEKDYVYIWRDCRGNSMPYRFRNLRYNSSSEWEKGTLNDIMPFVEANRLNGLGVVRMSQGPRWMALVNASDSSVANVETAFAILVYGSEYYADAMGGGGVAVLGNSSAIFKRGNMSESTLVGMQPDAYPITASAFSGFYNGRAVSNFSDKQEACFTDGWQILSLNTSLDGAAQTVQGIGLRSDADSATPNRRGGQSYAEILLFSEMPTDAERMRIEKSLSDKWGLPISHTGAPATELANISGSGEFVFESGNVGGFTGAYRGKFSVKDPLTETVSTVIVGNADDLVKVTGFRYDAEQGKYLIDVELADRTIKHGDYELLSGLSADAEIGLGTVVNPRGGENEFKFGTKDGTAVLTILPRGLLMLFK